MNGACKVSSPRARARHAREYSCAQAMIPKSRSSSIHGNQYLAAMSREEKESISGKGDGKGTPKRQLVKAPVSVSAVWLRQGLAVFSSFVPPNSLPRSPPSHYCIQRRLSCSLSSPPPPCLPASLSSFLCLTLTYHQATSYRTGSRRCQSTAQDSPSSPHPRAEAVFTFALNPL